MGNFYLLKVMDVLSILFCTIPSIDVVNLYILFFGILGPERVFFVGDMVMDKD